MLLKCPTGCDNAYQDKLYKGKRVMNATTKQDTYRCTVCSTEVRS